MKKLLNNLNFLVLTLILMTSFINNLNAMKQTHQISSIQQTEEGICGYHAIYNANCMASDLEIIINEKELFEKSANDCDPLYGQLALFNCTFSST